MRGSAGGTQLLLGVILAMLVANGSTSDRMQRKQLPPVSNATEGKPGLKNIVKIDKNINFSLQSGLFLLNKL